METEFAHFVELHEPQLKSINFPYQLYETLFRMLSKKNVGEVADTFKITKIHNSGMYNLSSSYSFMCILLSCLPAFSPSRF